MLMMDLKSKLFQGHIKLAKTQTAVKMHSLFVREDSEWQMESVVGVSTDSLVLASPTPSWTNAKNK